MHVCFVWRLARLFRLAAYDCFFCRRFFCSIALFKALIFEAIVGFLICAAMAFEVSDVRSNLLESCFFVIQIDVSSLIGVLHLGMHIKMQTRLVVGFWYLVCPREPLSSCGSLRKGSHILNRYAGVVLLLRCDKVLLSRYDVRLTYEVTGRSNKYLKRACYFFESGFCIFFSKEF